MAAKHLNGLPPIVKAMMRPGFYPHGPASVELAQTHISWVFLAGPLVYKVKKPVNFGFLDFSTLARRAGACAEEVRLNRRLSEGLYLGVSDIYKKAGVFSLKAEGRVAEKAVVMRRLPSERLLSSLMARGRATEAQVRKVAARVADFHRGAAPADFRYRNIAVLEETLRENFQQTLPYLGVTVRGRDYLVVWDYNRDFLSRRRKLLEKRVRDGRLRDGHGDLHAEHICLTRGIQIYDCIEFNPRIRQGDTASDIAFLYMDLLYHGHPLLARELMEEYLRRSGDWEARLLLPFYACYRAVVREKVESFRLADPAISRREKKAAVRRASGYFTLARRLAEKDSRPRLIIVGGLPGAGKSTVSRTFAELTGADHMNSDVVRKALAGASADTAFIAPAGEGIYKPEMTELTYREMIVQAGRALSAGRSVVLDATFPNELWRRRARGMAGRSGAVAIIVECRCPVSVVRRRLDERRKKKGVSDAGWEIYRALRRSYQGPSGTFVSVDTSRPPDEGLSKIAAAAYPF
ncbi:MAG: AAA family ATPase [Nitrospirae bacterium]|nr:AAA family ATPase [Nitrospirota bacterium]